MRGKNAKVGDTRISPNGYHYTRLKGGWELTHRVVAEKALGRKLAVNERVRFADGNRTNLSPDNILVYKTKAKTAGSRRAKLEAKLEEIQAELEALGEEAI